MSAGDHHATVGRHFDEDAEDYDARYWANPVLMRMRQAFREEVKRLPFSSALDAGCGTGLDLVHFGTIFPHRVFRGIDVSQRMVELSQARIDEHGRENATVQVASVEDAPDIADQAQFDLVYVFFGALNLVEDLEYAAERLYAATAPGGYLVLTVVNRLYLADIVIHLLKGRWKLAFRRFRPEWGGYSPMRFVRSSFISPADMKKAFNGQGQLLHRRGFSILYPAWYRARWVAKLRRASHWLWEADRWLNRTPMWRTGEYCLYVFRKHPVAPPGPGSK